MGPLPGCWTIGCPGERGRKRLPPGRTWLGAIVTRPFVKRLTELFLRLVDLQAIIKDTANSLSDVVREIDGLVTTNDITVLVSWVDHSCRILFSPIEHYFNVLTKDPRSF